MIEKDTLKPHAFIWSSPLCLFSDPCSTGIWSSKHARHFIKALTRSIVQRLPQFRHGKIMQRRRNRCINKRFLYLNEINFVVSSRRCQDRSRKRKIGNISFQ